LVLKQEGWHYEIESPTDPLTLKGVVYNEMKGVSQCSVQQSGITVAVARLVCQSVCVFCVLILCFFVFLSLLVTENGPLNC